MRRGLEMSDDRLFASNNAIGRKWYFLNIIILIIITLVTKYIFEDHIFPNVTTEVYEIIAKGILYFAYVIYAVTFFALIERRLYDAVGSREKQGYKNTSGFLQFAVIFQIAICIIKAANIQIPVSVDILQSIAWLLNGIFCIIFIILCFLRGQISNLTYDQYRKKIKYE